MDEDEEDEGGEEALKAGKSRGEATSMSDLRRKRTFEIELTNGEVQTFEVSPPLPFSRCQHETLTCPSRLVLISISKACFYASYAARLTVPLAYNFLTFLPEEEIVNKTVFYNFLGKLINLTAISEGFNDFFPALVLIPVCATLFNLYGRVKAVFGFGDVVDEDTEIAVRLINFPRKL